jgi:hypothetical protein
MNFQQIATPSPDVVSQVVAGETVLMDLASEHYYGLDAVGTRVWQLLAQGLDLDTLSRLLLEEYAVDEAQLKHDLIALVGELADLGLVSLTAPAVEA